MFNRNSRFRHFSWSILHYELQQFKEQVFLLIDKRIQTLEANSKQWHQE